MNMRLILIACRVLLGVVFLIACVHKILFPGAFALSIYHYQILPDPLINIAAITLPWVELVVAVAIMFSVRFKDAAATLILVLLGVFTVAMIYNILRGLDISCGCFSAAAEADALGWSNVYRNLGYMFIACVVLLEDWIKTMVNGG